MDISHFHFHGLIGVGEVKLTLQPHQQVYVFIGENGVGKTKLLEALFQFFMLGVSTKFQFYVGIKNRVYDQLATDNIYGANEKKIVSEKGFWSSNEGIVKHSFAMVYIGSHQRGFIRDGNSAVRIDSNQLGDFSKRNETYGQYLAMGMSKKGVSLSGSQQNIYEWIIKRASSASQFFSQTDNCAAEIKTLTRLLHKIDERIDAEFLEINGNNEVFIKILGQKRELAELSTGFSSILKIIQGIISGFANSKNQEDIANIEGLVFIDEIESHLHISWQTTIIPLLKKLFPRAIFFIATHSSLVLAQLREGEAYRLVRESENSVASALIPHPNKSTLVDLLDTAFGVDINAIKLANANSEDQQKAKQNNMEVNKKSYDILHVATAISESIDIVAFDNDIAKLKSLENTY